MLKKGQRIRLMRGATEHDVTDIGQFRPAMTACDELSAGQVGYFMAQIKNLSDVHIGDTVTDALKPAAEPLPGYKEPKPMVFSGLYPTNNNDFETLREALGQAEIERFQLHLSAGSQRGTWVSVSAAAFSACSIGRSFSSVSNAIAISISCRRRPNVTYEILTRKGEILVIDSPEKVPDAGQIEEFREPFVRINFLVPSGNIGDLMQMCSERRGVYVRTEYLSPTRAILVYEMPLAEIIYDLYDKLKSVTHGYGTMDYEFLGYRAADLVRLDVLVHHKRVDALSTIVHRATAERRGRKLLKKLREEIDRHLFEVVLASGDRFADHRPREHRADEKERDGQVLRRRHHAQAQAVGQAGGRQETHETSGSSGDPAGSLPRRAWNRISK